MGKLKVTLMEKFHVLGDKAVGRLLSCILIGQDCLVTALLAGEEPRMWLFPKLMGIFLGG